MNTSNRSGTADLEPSPSADWRTVYAAMHVPASGVPENATTLDHGRG